MRPLIATVAFFGLTFQVGCSFDASQLQALPDAKGNTAADVTPAFDTVSPNRGGQPADTHSPDRMVADTKPVDATLSTAIRAGGTIATGGTTTASGGIIATGGTIKAAGGTIPSMGGIIASDGGVVSLSCSPGFSPADPSLTDFSRFSYNQTSGRWGTPGNLTGKLFTYKDPKDHTGTMSILVLQETMVLTGTINPVLTDGGYAGGGLTFNQCVNTRAYSGIQFTLGGSTGGCNLFFQIQTYSQQFLTEGGGCSTGCYEFPKKRINVHPQRITITFAELAGTGKPATGAEIAAEMLGLQWQFEIPIGVGDGGIQSRCDTNLTIDDVKFVP